MDWEYTEEEWEEEWEQRMDEDKQKKGRKVRCLKRCLTGLVFQLTILLRNASAPAVFLASACAVAPSIIPLHAQTSGGLGSGMFGVGLGSYFTTVSGVTTRRSCQIAAKRLDPNWVHLET